MSTRKNFFYETDKKSLDMGIVSSLTYHSHLHPNLEFGYILSGKTTLYINDKEYLLSKGDAYCIFPHQIHSFKDITDHDPLKAVIIIFKDELVLTYKYLFKSQTLLSPQISIPVEIISPITDKIFSYAKTDLKYKEPIIGSLLTILLSVIFEQSELVSNERSLTSDAAQNILIYCNDNFNKDISLETLAKDLNLSKSYISKIFNKKLKTNFAECINQLRIQEAIASLNDGRTHVSEVAFECGFNSLRSFNRNFAEYMGITPQEYIKKLRNTKSAVK